MFHCRSSESDLTGALSPNEASQLLKSRFIPYLKATEQSASRPLALSSPLQGLQLVKLRLATVSITLGISAGSTISAPCRLRTAITSSMAARWASVSPPRGAALPGSVRRS